VQVFSIVVRGGFLVSLLGSYVLLMYPLRSCIAELAFGKAEAAKKSATSSSNQLSDLENKWFFPLTYGILLSTTAVAVLVPNIWAALSVVGDLASTVQAFILPALIGLALTLSQPWKQQQTGGGVTNVLVGTVVLVLGVSLFANGIIQRVT
jgi:ABC-type phosphate transport system permease subunit